MRVQQCGEGKWEIFKTKQFETAEESELGEGATQLRFVPSSLLLELESSGNDSVRSSNAMGPKERPAIVLAHGIVHPVGSLCDKIMRTSYFEVVPQFLLSKGFRVLTPEVSYMGHVKDRAQQLRNRISKWSDRRKDEKVIVIAHSMGGLDSRYMLSHLDGAELVDTLVTIGTPHKGCSVADVVLKKLSLHEVLGWKAIECLTRDYMRDEFNSACRDVEGVRYFSISGETEKIISNTLRPFRPLAQTDGPNDGMVSVESSKWGTHLGSYEVDHLQQVNLKRKQTRQIYNDVLHHVVERKAIEVGQ